MRVRDVMTKDPMTIESDALIAEARKTMKEKNIRRLPVVNSGKLVGIITKRDIDEAMPPPNTATAAYEFHHFLTNTRVEDVMKVNPITVSDDLPFEEILKVGQKRKISSFPVVKEGKLVGIITESDVVRFLTHVLGLNEEGSRITIEGTVAKWASHLQQIISIVGNYAGALLSMLSLERPEKNDWMMVLRIRSSNTGELLKDLKEAGLNVTYVA